jgi:hypothetical protein
MQGQRPFCAAAVVAGRAGPLQSPVWPSATAQQVQAVKGLQWPRAGQGAGWPADSAEVCKHGLWQLRLAHDTLLMCDLALGPAAASIRVAAPCTISCYARPMLTAPGPDPSHGAVAAPHITQTSNTRRLSHSLVG